MSEPGSWYVPKLTVCSKCGLSRFPLQARNGVCVDEVECARFAPLVKAQRAAIEKARKR